MKLRNKKTGEIMDDVQYRNYSLSNGFGFRMNGKEWEYHSLAELNEEWEDYEEPEVYWCIDADGSAVPCRRDDNEFDTVAKSIGNYFETKEEAEKAVERLKAWKRLKDNGFRFTSYGRYDTDGEKNPHIVFSYPNFDDLFDDDETVADLDLLFGGEE